MRILILCTGNSCRSQMGHGWMQSFTETLEVHSAGTEPAECVNPLAMKVMKEVGDRHFPSCAKEREWVSWRFLGLCDNGLRRSQ